jgi:sn-glycerol 3-phosphate transport system ATP-binding protein
MAAIRIRGLQKRFASQGGNSERPALAGLDLDVGDGELLVLVGPSGCGKSTALRLIAGLEEPTAGRVALVDDAGERDLTAVAPPERDIAMVFQGYALYPHLSVADNIAFPLKMRRVATAERQRRVEEVAEIVGLSDKLGRLPAELSGGERQRVAMGRAIVRKPAVFLFDEPLSNLDAKLRADLRVDLTSLVRRLGTTAIYVTHDQAEAMTMGDRIAVLRDGELQQVAPPRTIYQRPSNAFVASFVGTPAMNLLDMQLDAGRASTKGLSFAAPAEVAERSRVTVGFRPEHLRIGAQAADADGRFAADVTATEPLGPETLVHLRLGEHELRARAPGFADLGGAVEASVRGSDLLWFDADDGARIETGLGGS